MILWMQLLSLIQWKLHKAKKKKKQNSNFTYITILAKKTSNLFHEKVRTKYTLCTVREKMKASQSNYKWFTTPLRFHLVFIVRLTSFYALSLFIHSRVYNLLLFFTPLDKMHYKSFFLKQNSWAYSQDFLYNMLCISISMLTSFDSWSKPQCGIDFYYPFVPEFNVILI